MEFKHVECLLVVCLVLFTAHAQDRTQWCDDDDHDHDHDHYDHHENDTHVHPEDFLKIIFTYYGDNATCTITEEGFEELLHDLNIGGHNHTHEHGDTHDHHVCYDGHDLLHIHNISHGAGLTEMDFIEISPTLVEQVVHGCAPHDDHGTHDPPPSAAEVWGYGMAAVIIISACSLLGVPLARWHNHPAYKYILTFMLALAVGTLAGDAVMHLIPHGLGLHDHSTDDTTHSHSHEDGTIDVSVWKSFTTSLIILLFLNLQLLFGFVHRDPEKGNGNAVKPAVVTAEGKEKESGSINKSFGDLSLGTVDSQTTLISNAPESLGWMVVIGDSIHNFADGLAIAAAFSDSWQLGLSTSVAVLCHEIPHEFGDVAAMFSVGWSWKRVILMQVLTQSFAVLGLCIGIPVSEESEEANQWILMVAAGMFLYVALCDIVPELLRYFEAYKPTYILLLTNLGVLLGFALMLVISILEQLYGNH